MSAIEEVDCIQGLGDTFSDDYRAAVVHIAWERKELLRTLLLAWVELLPCEISPPHDDGEAKYRVKKDSYIYVRHVVTTAERALRWYRDCAEGVAVRPDNDGSLPDRSPTVVTLEMSPTDEEPRWPNLICTRSPILPFLGNWHECPRVHHLMAPTFNLGSLWNDNQQRHALQWLSEQLHFDLGDHRFLLGSVHLVAPNPVFRDLRKRIEASEDGTKERILLHVQSRAGKSAVGLQLRFLEQRPTGVCVSKQWTLTAASLSLQVNYILDEFAVEIHDPCRGLLWFESPTSIIRNIDLQMSVASGVRKIRDQDGPVLEVPLVTDMPPTSAGEPAVRKRGLMQLGEAAEMHQQRDARRALERWFNDQPDAAIDTVHKLIQDATQRVVIVDPYFARKELRFALAISRIKVPVSVLTSHDGLKKREKDDDELPESFVARVARITATPNMNPLEVRVMRGAGIHDRFLVIDDRVFLLGSSLNNFGKRGTMIVQLHTPGVVRAELLRELAASVPLQQWLASRRASQQPQASDAPTGVMHMDPHGEGI
jgi:hypothetical protein